MKTGELRLRHFARRTCELSSVAVRDVSDDRGIEGTIGEDKSRDVMPHQPSDDRRLGRIPANQAVSPEPEQITDPRDRRTRRWCRMNGFWPVFVRNADKLL